MRRRIIAPVIVLALALAAAPPGCGPRGRLGPSGASFRHTFPASSLTVLALTTR